MEKRGWLDKLQEGKEGERGGGGVFSLVNGVVVVRLLGCFVAFWRCLMVLFGL